MKAPGHPLDQSTNLLCTFYLTEPWDMVKRHLALIWQMGKEEHLFPVEEVWLFLGFLPDRLHKMLYIDISFCMYLVSSTLFWLHHWSCLFPCGHYCHDIVQLTLSLDAWECRPEWLDLSQPLIGSKAHYPIKCTYYWKLKRPCCFVILLFLTVLYPLFLLLPSHN